MAEHPAGAEKTIHKEILIRTEGDNQCGLKYFKKKSKKKFRFVRSVVIIFADTFQEAGNIG
jgi:hypothetical protein